MSPLLGGEVVIAFLALRIALWMWRSRAAIRTILEPAPPGPGTGRPQAQPRPLLRLAHAAPPREAASLPRAA